MYREYRERELMYHGIYRERAIGIQDLTYIERVREYRASERNLRSDIYRWSKRVYL